MSASDVSPLPWEARRLFPPTRTALWGAVILATAFVVARWERTQQLLGAADRGLSFALGVLLPLAATGAVVHLAGGANLREVGSAAARFGLDRRRRLLGAWLLVTAGLALFAALLGVVTLLGARGTSDAQLGADLLATLPVALLAAPAYAAWLGVGATFGRQGAGLLVVLLVDWLLGATGLPAALATPRGHIRILLGLEGAFSHPAWGSFLALVGMTALATAILTWRTPR